MSVLARAETILAREVVLRVDFDLIDDDGCAWVSTRFHRTSAAESPRPGDVVYLLDSRGSGCVGRVEQVDGWYVCVQPDWSTWTGGGDSGRPRGSVRRARTRGRRA